MSGKVFAILNPYFIFLQVGKPLIFCQSIGDILRRFSYCSDFVHICAHEFASVFEKSTEVFYSLESAWLNAQFCQQNKQIIAGKYGIKLKVFCLQSVARYDMNTIDI